MTHSPAVSLARQYFTKRVGMRWEVWWRWADCRIDPHSGTGEWMVPLGVRFWFRNNASRVAQELHLTYNYGKFSWDPPREVPSVPSVPSASPPPEEPNWKWWAGRSEEYYDLGPFDTREEAIEQGRDYYGNTSFVVAEAYKRPSSMAVFDAVTWLENLLERDAEAECPQFTDDDGDPDGEVEKLFGVNSDLLMDLDVRVNEVIRTWQNSIGLHVDPWYFTDVRNEEDVPKRTHSRVWDTPR